jgi:tungstate transport system ATP-binding protein
MLERPDGIDRRPHAASVPMFPLQASNLTFEDRGRTLVDGVTLRLERGSRTVVMGPNGAGKSLLLRMLHGLVQPTRGEVSWAGLPASETVRARQAMVFQRPTLLRRSVEANIRFVLSSLDATEALERTQQILTRAGLVHLAQSPARLLSGGEQQRLSIARALALEPAILFLAEPCSSLDPASTHAVEELIETAHADGAKIVLVTHDIGQARRLADEIVFLHQGRFVEHAPAAQFFAAPKAGAARAYLAGRIPL